MFRYLKHFIVIGGCFHQTKAMAWKQCVGSYESTSSPNCSDDSCHYAEIYHGQNAPIVTFAGIAKGLKVASGSQGWSFSAQWPSTCPRMGCFELLSLNGTLTVTSDGICKVEVEYLYQWFHEDANRPTQHVISSVFYRVEDDRQDARF